MRGSLPVFVVCLTLAGCKGEPTKVSPATGQGSGESGSTADQARPPETAISVYVDGQVAAHIKHPQLAQWPPLDSLLPEQARRLGTWQTVELRRGSAEPVTMSRPSSNHPDTVPVVFPGTNGQPAFGMFDRVELAKHGTAAVRHDGVTEIHIQLATEGRGGDHQGQSGSTEDPRKLVLTIKTPKGERSLTGDAILALPREPIPGSEDNRGWQLAQFLTAAGVTTYSKLMLIDAGGASLPLTREELADPSTSAFIKLNRQGALRFRLLKRQGTGVQVAGELRALTTIQVD